MLKKKLFLFYFYLLFTLGKTALVEKTSSWVKKTFEENDACFEYGIDEK